MKVLKTVKNTLLGHKYITIIFSLLIIGSGGVFALANTSNTSGITKPQIQTTQTSNATDTSGTPSNTSTGSGTQSTTEPTPTTTTPSQSGTTTPNIGNQTNNNTTTTPPAPTCNTAAEAQDVTAFQNAYSADQSQAYSAIYAFGYSPPFPQSIEPQVLAIENTFNTKWTDLKITFENEMSSINCAASVPSETGLNFSL
jgi:cytoskeletal protein RodZ